MLVAYYHLKVPLAIFKREKEIARRLEFDGLYIAEQPEDDDMRVCWIFIKRLITINNFMIGRIVKGLLGQISHFGQILPG